MIYLMPNNSNKNKVNCIKIKIIQQVKGYNKWMVMINIIRNLLKWLMINLQKKEIVLYHII